MKRIARAWWWRLLAAVLLALVFLAYIQPAMMINLSEQIWACF
ncbi:hypothetical protein [Roseateles sp. PN1]